MNSNIQRLVDRVATDSSGKWVAVANLPEFAELIVKECAQFVEDKFDFIGEEIIVKEKILEHFGVEE